jgi:DNA polymerase elongation subunit (family B)
MTKKCVLDIETENLDPKVGRIICVGIMDTEVGRPITFHDENEKQMLIDFLDYFHRKEFREIIGYNVLFDIRFIFGRCLRYGLTSNGFFSAKHTDLMHIMKSVKPVWSMNKPGTLDEWTEFLFGAGKIRLPDNISNLFEQGKIGQIIQYNKRDVEITYRLWERIQKVLNNGNRM